MGKASGTSQQNVVKPKLLHVVGDGTGAAFGGEVDSQDTPPNACLFSVELKIDYKTGEGSQRFVKGDSVTLARVGTSDIAVFVKNRRLTTYTGQLKEQLLECMSKGYVYSGEVQGVGANTLRAMVRGGVMRRAAT